MVTAPIAATITRAAEATVGGLLRNFDRRRSTRLGRLIAKCLGTFTRLDPMAAELPPLGEGRTLWVTDRGFVWPETGSG